VEINKCGLGLNEFLFKYIKDHEITSIAYEASRTPISTLKTMEQTLDAKAMDEAKLSKLLSYQTFRADGELYCAKRPDSESTHLKLERVIKNEHEAIFVSALDSISWLSNLRSNGIPNSSFFLAKSIATSQTLYLFLNTEVPSDKIGSDNIKIFSEDSFEDVLKSITADGKIERILYDAERITAKDYHSLCGVVSEDNLDEFPGGLYTFQSRKLDSELAAIRESFDLADLAILNSIKTIRQKVKSGQQVSERDLYNETNSSYKNLGALSQSFTTIASTGVNSSVIHYGDASDKVFVEDGDWMLLDSGGYWESGFATDTTRTFMANPDAEPSTEQKKIYTLVLKGYINASTAIVKEGTIGAVIDGLARAPINEYGYNYEHGTGHGVGISVHEEGIKFRPSSNTPIYPGQVVSIEPGIYLPGFGGCRFENIIEVVAHPKFPGFVYFESLVYIGLDLALIDDSLLSEKERLWVENYQKKCAKLNRVF